MQCLAPILCFERGSAEYPVQPPAMAPVSRLDCTASRVETPAGRSSLRSERGGGEGLSGRLDTVHFCQSHRKLRNWVEARIVPTFKSRLTFTLTTATHIRPPFILVATRAETFDTLSTSECSSASSTFWVDENVN